MKASELFEITTSNENVWECADHDINYRIVETADNVVLAFRGTDAWLAGGSLTLSFKDIWIDFLNLFRHKSGWPCGLYLARNTLLQIYIKASKEAVIKGKPLALTGWSLGGMYAKYCTAYQGVEYAICFGTPKIYTKKTIKELPIFSWRVADIRHSGDLIANKMYPFYSDFGVKLFVGTGKRTLKNHDIRKYGEAIKQWEAMVK